MAASRKPDMIIDFQGTWVSDLKKGLPVKETASQFSTDKNVEALFLPGAGAETKTNDGKTSYTPGTATFKLEGTDNEKKVTQIPKKFGPKLFYRVAGYIRGTGEEDNLKLALAHIQVLFEKKNKDKKELDDKKQETIHLKLSGFSRGGASAIALANEIYKRYGNRITVDLFVSDPNPGFGRVDSSRKTNIPPNVKKAIFSFSAKKPSFFASLFSLRAPKYGLENYIFTNPMTKVSAYCFSGSHRDQNLLLRNSEKKNPNPVTIAAHDNAILMQHFLNDSNVTEGELQSLQKEIKSGSRKLHLEAKERYPAIDYNSLKVPEEIKVGEKMIKVNAFKELHEKLIGCADAKESFAYSPKTLQLNYDCYLLFCELLREYREPRTHKKALLRIALETSSLLHFTRSLEKNPLNATEFLKWSHHFLTYFHEHTDMDNIGSRVRHQISRISDGLEKIAEEHTQHNMKHASGK